MILPSKHISLQNSYLGAGKVVLEALTRPSSVDALWKKVVSKPGIANTRRFYLTLDLLYMMGVIEYQNGKIRRVK